MFKEAAWAWTRSAIRNSALVCAILAVVSFAVPPVLGWVETGEYGALEYEAAMRIYLTLAIGLALVGSLLFFGHRFDGLGRRIWRALAVTAGMLLLIFALDMRNQLMHEYSWIRYPTAIALILAGSIALVIAKRSGPRHRVAWAILGAGFLFGGFDEVFQLHEAIPNLVRIENDTIAGVWNDLSTVLLFLIGVAVVVVLWRKLRADGPEGGLPAWLMRGYWTAMFVFGLSQFFDTADRFFRIGLEYGADGLAAAGHRFPDYWYLIASPVVLLNSIEEILELTAAVLFFACTWHYLKVRDDNPEPQGRPWGRAPRAAYGIVTALLVILGWGAATAGSPLTDGREAWIEKSERDRDAELLRAQERAENLPLRRMFRDVRGTKTGPGGLQFETGSLNGEMIVPRMLWRVSSETQQAGK
jgi:hypothetical protein